MAKILIVGNPESPLVRERGLVGQAAGHEIYWFSPVKANIPGVRSFGLPSTITRSMLLTQVFQPKYFRRALSTVRPDLVHVHYAFKGSLAWHLGRFHPLVVTTMGSDISPTGAYRGFLAPFTRHLLDRADRVTVKSTYMLEMVQMIGNYAHKTERITWGVDLNLFKPTREIKALKEHLQIPQGALVFFDSRATRPLYNKHLLVDAFGAYLSKGCPEAVLLISEFNASHGYLQQIKQRVKTLRLEHRVRFLPPQNKEGMADLYALADVVVSIPSSDGFPQTIYEAWASGRFLILGDLPQYREELKGGVTAKLVKLRNVNELTDALIWVARHPEIRQAAREAGRSRAQAVGDKTEQAEKMNLLYAKLLAMTHD